jgi:hypothetical protein
VTTFKNMLDATQRRWTPIVQIESVGYGLSDADIAASDGDGLCKFVIELADYMSADIAIHMAVLAEVPDAMAERVRLGGGFPEYGEIDFGLVDVGDALTSLLAPDVDPVTYLDTAIDADDTSVVVEDASAFSETAPDNVIFIGREALWIDAIASNTLTVTRGYLGTDAASHDAGASCYTTTPFLYGRRIWYSLVPSDSTVSTEETIVGEYVLDSLEVDEFWGTYRIRGASRLRYLHRVAPASPREATISHVYPPGPSGRDGIAVDTGNGWGIAYWRAWTGTEADSDSQFYLRIGNEVVSVGSATLANGVVLSRRDVLGTGKIETLEPGQLVRQVFVAEESGPCSFRWSPGGSPSESRGSGTWTKSAHWVDVCLSIMTSSATEDDGLELVNYSSTYGNWSWMPAGYGIGVPQAQIDWASWLDVKARTPDWRFPWFVFGHEAMSFGDLLEQHFLRPLGAYVSNQSGVCKLVLPRLPTADSATVTLGSAQILLREVARGQKFPRVTMRRSYTSLASSIVYEIGDGSSSDKERLVVNSGEFADLFGGPSLYGDQGRPETIAAPSCRPRDATTQTMLGLAAARKLLRLHRPLTEVELDVDTSEFIDAVPGAIASITLGDAPAFSGSRGWTARLAEITEVEPVIDVGSSGAESGDYLRIKALMHGALFTVCTIAPAAWIESIDGNEATVAANRYTHSDATGSLPLTDAAAFAVGDECKLYNLDGSAVSADTQTISTLAGNVITFDGNFGGNLAADLIIGYALRASCSTTQTTNTAFASDRATATAPCTYGEA